MAAPYAALTKDSRISIAYLLAIPLLLLAALLSSAVFLIFCTSDKPFKALCSLLLLTIGAIGLLSATFFLYHFTKAKPPALQLIIAAVLLYSGGFIPLAGILLCIPCYFTALRRFKAIPHEAFKGIFKRVLSITAAALILITALLYGFVWLLFADHYYETPKIGKGMNHSELYAAIDEPTLLVELDHSHVIGIYEGNYNSYQNPSIGFALFSVKEKADKLLYCYLSDTGFCYPSSIFEENDEGYWRYTEGNHLLEETCSWGQWIMLSDAYQICMIPESSQLTPEKGPILLHTQSLTLNHKSFRLYIAAVPAS